MLPMRNQLWAVFSLALVGATGFGQTTPNVHWDTISFAYEVEGESPLFSYRLTEHCKKRITCELVAEGRIIERERFGSWAPAATG